MGPVTQGVELDFLVHHPKGGCRQQLMVCTDEWEATGRGRAYGRGQRIFSGGGSHVEVPWAPRLASQSAISLPVHTSSGRESPACSKVA
jgi:hypothetical protein